MLYFPSHMSLCIITIRPNICIYRHVSIYVTDLHKQIELLAFFFLSLAGMVPEWKGYWLIPQTPYRPKHQWDYLEKPKKETERSQNVKVRRDHQIQPFPPPGSLTFQIHREVLSELPKFIWIISGNIGAPSEYFTRPLVVSLSCHISLLWLTHSCLWGELPNLGHMETSTPSQPSRICAWAIFFWPWV